MQKERSLGWKLFGEVLEGALNMGARAIARAGESLASDTKKVLRDKAAKAELVQKTIEAWRVFQIGELADSDLPDDLKDGFKEETKSN